MFFKKLNDNFYLFLTSMKLKISFIFIIEGLIKLDKVKLRSAAFIVSLYITSSLVEREKENIN